MICLTDVVLQQTRTTNSSPQPPASGGHAVSDPVDEQMLGGPAPCPSSESGSGGPAQGPSPTFDALWKAYPLRPGMSRERARCQWAAMPDEMQREAFGYVATVLAPAYADPASRPRHLCNFLRDRDWTGHAELARPPPALATCVRVGRDTPEGRAWTEHELRAGRAAPKWFHVDGPDGPGRWFPSRWPPGRESVQPSVRPPFRNKTLEAGRRLLEELDADFNDVR